jgi:selenide,water dikinase
VLVLGKPLGVGILSAALKKGLLDAAGYAQMVHHTTQLNKVGIALAQIDGVHAMTDVTGFGLAGHLLEICRGSGLSAQVDAAALPLIDSAVRFAQQGIATGASARNWEGYGDQVQYQGSDWLKALVTDPQTSGGLLVSCSPAAAPAVLAAFHQAGFAQAAQIGSMQAPAHGQAVQLAF